MPRLITNGVHWTTHGTRLYPIDAMGNAITAGLSVHTQYSRALKLPVVTSSVSEATSNLTLRLTPADARKFAQALIQAADVADAVALELEGRRAA
jgi:hypothetical protein